MPKYIIRGDEHCELPRGSKVYVIPVSNPLPGQLIMFGTTAGARIGVGRWLPNVGGRNWVLQPGRLIAEVEDCHFVIHGAVVPFVDPPKEITNLTVEEHITALLCAQEVRG